MKTSREVDHSKVIETKSVAPSRRVIESNHLIIRENETRNVGTIQHNHTVIEKELVLTKRNVDTKTVDTVVNLVEHKYNTQRQRIVEQRELPGTVRDLRNCNCDGPRHPRLRHGGAVAPPRHPIRAALARATVRDPNATLENAQASAAPPGHQRGGLAF